MTNWHDLKQRDDYKKWDSWKIREKAPMAVAVHYASALCFALAAIVAATTPMV